MAISLGLDEAATFSRERMVDLAAEMYRQHLAFVCDDDAMRRLAEHGVSDTARLLAGNVGVAEIETRSDGTYEPVESWSTRPQRAFVVPCYSGQPVRVPIMDPRDPAPIELCAWFPGNPRRWWLRRGDAVLLGEFGVEIADARCEPLLLHRTPLAWIRAAGDGAVVVGNWAAAADLLHGIELVAEDSAHAAGLDHRLTMPARRPTILLAA